MCRRASAVFFLLLLAVTAALAGEIKWPDTAGKPWSVIFVPWETSGVPRDAQYLAQSLPLQIRSYLLSWDEHPLTEEELSRWKEQLIHDQRAGILKALASAARARDEARLSGETKAQVKKRQETWQVQRDLLTALAEEEPDLGEGVVLEYPVHQSDQPLFPLQKAVSRELSWVIRGRIERLAEGYLRYSLWVESFLGEGRKLLWEDAGRPEESESLAWEAAAALAALVAGAEPARLELDIEPRGSLIYLNGELLALSGRDQLLVKPGIHKIELKSPGYEAYSDQWELAPGEVRRFSRSLLPREPLLLTLETDPPGARVSRGGLWLGGTPLDVKVLPTGEELFFRLTQEGYVPENIFLRPRDSQSELSIFREFRAQERDPKELMEAKENLFYRDLGLFVLSSFLPVVFNGLTSNYEVLYTDTFSEEARQTGLFYYYSYGVSLTFSGLMLGKTLLSLRQYLMAAEDYVR